MARVDAMRGSELRAHRDHTHFSLRTVLTLPENALREWIAGVTVHASTHRCVTDYVTIGVRAARTDARILALLIDAG